ncbi:MAG: signal recognition particle receptor subunit alpha [Candidatus ainarchaeum sp.]|nr:signal recognition particle receptor subunit alpha [Candidatus ainarchaeum sp.]
MDLGKSLRALINKITNAPVVDEATLKSFIKELQRILIASDVNVKLVFELSKKIEKRASAGEVPKGLTMREHLLKVVYDELVSFMGTSYEPRLDRHKVLLCGLFGSGKTTSAAKVAYFYKKKGMKVGMVGADVERPAAQEQLQQLAEQIGVNYYTVKGEKEAYKVVEDALRRSKDDILIVDSAGRSAFDSRLADELSKIIRVLRPDESYLVVSGDIGQIAGKQAEEFNKLTPITGVLVTKMDGSGKGGGALSAVAATGSKIAFIGVGEKMEDLQAYDSERFVGRLLGIPDIQGLMEKVKEISESGEMQAPEEVTELTVDVFYQQLKAAKKLGPLDSVFSMMGMSDMPREVMDQGQDKLKKYESIISSMTKAERKDASLVRKSRARMERIAKGAGCELEDVRRFLSEFSKMEQMFTRFRKDRGLRKKLEKMMKGKGLPLGM